MDCSITSLAGCEEFIISSPYCFTYGLTNRVFNVGGESTSAVKVYFSPLELVREATSFSVSLVEILTTLLEDALALPLDFLFMTVVYSDPHCLSLRSRDRDKPFLLLVVRISIDHSKFPFRDGNHSGWC